MVVATNLIFFVSGISGLIYEIIWVRQFGNLFGNTMQSASLVTAVFMAGLGLGSYWAGRWIDRRGEINFTSLLGAYAVLEIAVGVGNLILSNITPHLETLSSSITTYVAVAEKANWLTLSTTSYGFRFLLVTVLTFPITFAMGATLPVLIKAVAQSDLNKIGRRIGLLYGLNTAGAALGALSVDFFLIPAWGLKSTQWIAATLNLVCALAAWAVGKSGREQRAAAVSADGNSGVLALNRHLVGLSAGLFMAGFTAMGLQLIWFRFLTGILEGTRAVFSLLLCTILSALCLGSWWGAALAKNDGPRWRQPLNLLLISQCLLPLTTFGLLYAFERSSMHVRFFRELHDSYPNAGTFIASLFLIHPIIWVVFVPALLTGVSYPVANSIVQDRSEAIGRRAGALYIWNTYGAIGGALLTGLVLIPAFGMQKSLTFLGAMGLLSIVGFSIARKPGLGTELIALAAMIFVLMGIGLWVHLPGEFLLDKIYAESVVPGSHYLQKQEGLVESVAVAETARGDGPASRALLTNGFMMSWTSPVALRYMHSFVHIPLLQIEDPKAVLVICFGVGNTASTVALYPSVSRIEIADLSNEVLGLASYFRAWNRDILSDPRTHVFVNDGREHLRQSAPQSFDLITLEPPPLSHAGVASLYSTEFYQLAKSRLKVGGFLTQWLPLGQAPAEATSSMLHAFIEVFPNMVLLAASDAHLIMLGKNDLDNTIDPVAVMKRIDSIPTVKADLQHILMASPLEFFGSFLNSGAHLVSVVEPTAPLTDDWPILEHWRTAFESTQAPLGLFAPERLDEWCPKCFVDGKLIPELAHYRIYSGFIYRTIFGRAKGETPLKDLANLNTAEGETIRSSPYLMAHAEGQFK